MGAERPKELILKNEVEEGDSSTVDVLVWFGASWNNCGCTTSRKVLSAITENTPHILEVPFKCHICPQFTEMKGKKKNEK